MLPVHQIVDPRQKLFLRIGLDIVTDIACILPVQTAILQYDHLKKDAIFYSPPKSSDKSSALRNRFPKQFGAGPINTGFRSMSRFRDTGSILDPTLFSGTLLHDISILHRRSSCLSVQSIQSGFFKIQHIHFLRISIIISYVFQTL